MQRLPPDPNHPYPFPMPVGENQSTTSGRVRSRARNPVPNYWEQQANQYAQENRVAEEPWATPAPAVDPSPWRVSSSVQEESHPFEELREIQAFPPSLPVDGPPVLNLQQEMPDRSATDIVRFPQSDEQSSVILIDSSNLASPETEEKVANISRRAPMSPGGTVSIRTIFVERASGENAMSRVEFASPPTPR